MTLFVQIHHGDLVHSTARQVKLPIGVATMLRTTPPPDGIGFVLKLSDLGSNLTRPHSRFAIPDVAIVRDRDSIRFRL